MPHPFSPLMFAPVPVALPFLSPYIRKKYPGVVLVMYLLDFSYWKGVWIQVRTVLLVLAGLALAAGCILMAREYAALPMLCFLLTVPAYIYMLNKTVWKHVDPYYFLSSLSPALLVMGICGIIAWTMFTVVEMEDGQRSVWPGAYQRVKANYYEKLQGMDTSKWCQIYTCWEEGKNAKDQGKSLASTIRCRAIWFYVY